MAEMPGVGQIDESCPFFGRIWKIILKYKKICFSKLNGQKGYFYYLLYNIKCGPFIIKLIKRFYK